MWWTLLSFLSCDGSCSFLWFWGYANLLCKYCSIICILYASTPFCRGNSAKISNLIYVLKENIQILHAHIKGEFSLPIGLWRNLSILFSMIFKKMGKYIQSSISSPPYALCIELTWTFSNHFWDVLSSITKKGEIESI